MSFREWQTERATTEALDVARAKARTQGREPTAAEFAAAINSLGPPLKRRKPKHKQGDQRAWHFNIWLGEPGTDHWLNQIREAPGGFDPAYLAANLSDQDFCHAPSEYDCRKALTNARERIALIESVLAEVEKQKRESAS